MNNCDKMEIEYSLLIAEYRKQIATIVEVVISELEWELHIRTGYSKDEYLLLLQKLVHQKVITEGVSYSKDEICMLHQALNEFYHGFDNSGWENLISLKKDQGELIMSALKKVIQE